MSVKICEECGKEFQVRHWHDKWCGPECKDVATKRRHRVNNAKYRAAKEKVKAPSMQPKQCPVCHETYDPISPNQKSCEKFACRRAVGAYASKDSIEPCIVCGKDFLVKKHSYRQTCCDECERIFKQGAQKTKDKPKDEKPDHGWKDTMPCPWSSGQLTHPPVTGYGWHTAEADPMSAGWESEGVWFVVRESEAERERRAA